MLIYVKILDLTELLFLSCRKWLSVVREFVYARQGL